MAARPASRGVLGFAGWPPPLKQPGIQPRGTPQRTACHPWPALLLRLRSHSPWTGPPQASLGRSCRAIGRPCFARWSVARDRPARGHEPGPWASAEGYRGRAGALALGLGPASTTVQGNKAPAGGGQGHGQCPMVRPLPWQPGTGTGLHMHRPRGRGGLLARVRTAGEGVKARRRRRWRRPLGCSIRRLNGALDGP